MSTLAEQIAAVKLGLKRLRNSSIDPTGLDYISDAIETLEGMAAPGELATALQQIAMLPDDHVYVRARGIAMRALKWETLPTAPGDSPSPQQPTTEALLSCPFCGGEADPNYWATLDREGGDEINRGPGCMDCGAQAMSVADWNRRVDLDCFAAQRVTDLQGQLERMRQRYHASIEEGMAATDKARREAITAYGYTRLFNAISDAVEWRPHKMLGISVEKFLRALTPQNPGDAAPHQEGEE